MSTHESFAPPPIVKQLFQRLTRGNNLIVSENGPNGDAELFRVVVENELEDTCRRYFAAIGFCFMMGDNCFYLTSENEPVITQEDKLKRLIELVSLLNLLIRHIEGFGEGVVFSETDLASRCQVDVHSSKTLQRFGCKGETTADRVEDLVRKLSSRGYIADLQTEQKEFRVLSAVNYLFEIAARVSIHEEMEGEDE